MRTSTSLPCLQDFSVLGLGVGKFPRRVSLSASPTLHAPTSCSVVTPRPSSSHDDKQDDSNTFSSCLQWSLEYTPLPTPTSDPSPLLFPINQKAPMKAESALQAWQDHIFPCLLSSCKLHPFEMILDSYYTKRACMVLPLNSKLHKGRYPAHLSVRSSIVLPEPSSFPGKADTQNNEFYHPT